MDAILNAKFNWLEVVAYGQSPCSAGKKILKRCPDRLVMPTIDIGDIDIYHAITFCGVSAKGHISRQGTTFRWTVTDAVDFWKLREQLCCSSCERYSKWEKKKKRKRYCVEKHRSHFKSSLGSLAPNCQVTAGILQIQSSLSCFNCLKFVLWWLTGSPLKIINGSQLLKFRKCSSALGHCNNQPRKRKGLGIYEVSQFITIWEKYSRTLV